MRHNQFGGSVGGPIRKDKTFFFFDFDGVREGSGTTANGGVPDAAERAGRLRRTLFAGRAELVRRRTEFAK